MGMKRAILKNSVAERQQTPADRWLRQAAELRARWTSGTLAYNFPRLEFLRQAAARCPAHHRWQKLVARFYPQIHLAIQPLLREALWPDRYAEAARPGYAVATPQEIVARRFTPGTAGVRDFLLPSPRRITEQADPASARLGFIEHAATLAQRLRRYTMRQVEVDESRLELSVRRLTRQVRRVEERLPGAPQMVVHKPAPATVRTERRETPEPERFQRPAQVWDTVNEAPRVRAATAPSLSIEQLTDQVIRQIDSRVIAMRERMGRI
jgi:hypothetical protein